jgi:hypothetical protein
MNGQTPRRRTSLSESAPVAPNPAKTRALARNKRVEGRWRLDLSHPNGEVSEGTIERVWLNGDWNRHSSRIKASVWDTTLGLSLVAAVEPCDCCGAPVVVGYRIPRAETADLKATLTHDTRRLLGELVARIAAEAKLIRHWNDQFEQPEPEQPKAL